MYKRQDKVSSHLNRFNKPYFFTEDTLTGLTDFKKNYPLDTLSGKKVIVFSGLGNNTYFFGTVKKLSKSYNFTVKEFVPLPDHYSYKDFKVSDNQLYLTTEKDLVKLPPISNVLALQYRIKPEQQFYKFLKEKVEKLKKIYQV